MAGTVGVATHALRDRRPNSSDRYPPADGPGGQYVDELCVCGLEELRLLLRFYAQRAGEPDRSPRRRGDFEQGQQN